jgi:uncharacterized phiE125 gp8 family phage protein
LTVVGLMAHLQMDASNAQVQSTDVIITVVAPGALTGDTTVPVTPLTVGFAVDDLLTFDTNKVVVVAEAAAIDDEEVTVEELPFNLDAGAEATIPADSDLNDLITDAREWAEGETHRALITQGWRLTLDAFPCRRCDERESLDTRGDIIRLPWPNLQSVESIVYIDANGDEQELAEDTDFVVDAASLPGRVLPAYGKCWPVARCQPNAVTIEYTAGYGASASTVPRAVRRAMLLKAGDLHRNREGQIVGTITAENRTMMNLLGPHIYREAR